MVLSGCGVYDGTEVHEAAAALGNMKLQAVPQYWRHDYLKSVGDRVDIGLVQGVPEKSPY